MMAIGMVDWTAVGEAVRRGGDDVMGRIEAAGVAPGLVVAVLSIGWSIIAVAVLSGISGDGLRWWISGFRFGEWGVRRNCARARSTRVFPLHVDRVVAGVVLAIGAAITLAITAGSNNGSARARLPNCSRQRS